MSYVSTDIKKIIAEIIENKKEKGGVKNIYFVGCGGSLGALYPAKTFMEREAQVLRSAWINSNEFVHSTPKDFGENSIICLACHKGNTPETIQAAKLGKEKGAAVIILLPVINEIAIETGVRPERPISASIVSSQQAITACPISAATVGILAFMAEATNYTKVNIFTLLIVCVPATLIGTVIAAIAVIKKGKELADDPEFQARVEAGLIEDFSKKVKEEKKVSKEAKISVTIFLIAMVGIVLLGAVSGLVPTLADGSKLPLTTVIEIFMLVAAAAMILLTKLDSNKVLDQPVFRTGMFAVVLAFGLCWLVNTFIGDQSSFITDNMSALTNKYPWIFIVAVFIVGAITTSQSSTTMIMIPIGIALGLPANVIVAGWIACSSNYFIPASGQCVAALAFDSAGTTKIGKFVLNHSYMIPGLVCTVVSVVVALLIGAVVF